MIKIGNRRRKRNGFLLDVKVQTEGRLRSRVRWLSAIAAVVAITGLTGYGVYRMVKFTAARLVYENPRFAITEITADTDGGLTKQQILNLAGVAVGQNILSIDLAQVQRNLEAVPVIRCVEVRRVMPAKLLIRVNERIAVARLKAADAQVLFIDRAGMVMTPIRFHDGTVIQPQAPGTLPVLTGVALVDVRVGKQVQSEQIYRALELLDKVQQAAAGSMMEIATVDLAKPRHLTLTTKQNTQVKFDVTGFQQQMRRLSAIMTWAAQRQKLVTAVDLTVARGVPVAFSN
ncbi:MAG: FtsQ-type POTRA domain-containing protein [Verrucomicrobiota bacterium]|jgi:cell division protein FtsQ